MASVPGPRLNAGSSSGSSGSHGSGTNHTPTCHPSEAIEATILFSIATAGILANLALIGLILLRKPVKKYRRAWSQGLILHQGVVDLARALLLVPLGVSVVLCQRSHRCSIIDTAFLLLVSVSTVNMLTTLINDAPIFPENEQLGSISAAVSGRLRNDHTWLDVSTQLKMNEGGDSDSPYCIVFGIFIIWFASLTINLGPTFLSGGLNSGDGHIDVCPMVYRPARHYVLNVLWIAVNLMCVSLMAIHLRKLYRDIVKSNFEAVRLASFVTTMIPVQNESSERNQKHLHGYIGRLELEGISRVKMFVVILVAYILFWGPLFWSHCSI
ncbi:hypothetical protein HDE_03107 [Halotydeus destructor]|nr:hypothetical protein HDE_03107 [Halotydeus destructor]